MRMVRNIPKADMFQTPLISLVVPVYKAEKYLDRCIASILAQTYSIWELLLVDDGSPDRSGELCDVWSKKDCRIRVLHKTNGGVSSARNIGIEQAIGDWITFIDSDDWISQNYLESFVNNLKCGERTIYLQGIQMFTIHKGLLPLFSYEDDFYLIKEHIKHFTSKKILANGCPVAKLFNISILKDNNIRFDETISINEDHLFVLTYYNYIDNVCTISDLSYYYYYDFTVPSLTKINHLYTELHRVSFLMSNAYKLICSKFKLTEDDKLILNPLFGPNQAMEALLSCMSNKESISSFCLCEEYLMKNFGCEYDKYDLIYRPYLRILSLKTEVKIKYYIFKLIYTCDYIKNMVKYHVKIFFWRSNIKRNKL